MKRKAHYITIFGLLTMCAFALTGCGESKPTLKFYNWGEYASYDVISDFEDEYNCKVICDYYDSNETMYNKIQSGDSYDVMIPSDYMIERLISEDRLMELDKSQLPNLEKMTEGVKGLDFDQNNTYSAPYFWGSVGILYNPETVSTETVESQGWNVLKNTEYKGRIYMYDSERDSFMVALKALGYSMNTENESEIEEAYQWLKELNDTMEPVYVTDEVIDNMISGNKDMAVVYSGDGTFISSENENLKYYEPEQGTNIWCDAMVISKDCENPELAHQFINYMLGNEASKANSEFVGYTTSNDEVMKEISGEGGAFSGNPAYTVRQSYEKDEVFHDNEVIRKLLSDYWIKVKASEQ